MKKASLIFAAALISAAVMTSCWEVNPPENPAISVAPQVGAITAGTAGTAIFVVSTADIADSQTGTIQWHSDANGGAAASAPAGVTASVSTGSSHRTLTVTARQNTVAGTYYFSVTIAGTASNIGKLTIDPSTAKTVTIGEQDGEIEAGTPGSVTFTVNTENIAVSEQGSVQWYSDADGTTAAANAPSGITASVSTGNANRTLTMTTGADTKQGTYYFRVTIDDVVSNVGTLTIDAPEKSVNVGAASGTMAAGVADNMVAYPVTTQNIADGNYLVTVSNLPVDVTVYRAHVGDILSVDVVISDGSGWLMLTGNGSQTAGNVNNLILTLDDTQSNQFSLSIVAKTVTVGSQSRTLRTGAPGTTTYSVTTANTDNSQAGTIQWYSNSGGTTETSAPTGVTTSVSTGNATRTMTVNTTNATPAGTYYFRVTIDGVESNVGTLTISAPVKSVTVGAASGPMAAGVADDMVSYPVTTQNIADGIYTVTVTNLPTGVTVYRTHVGDVLSFDVAISDGGGWLTLRGNGSQTARNVNNLRLTLDDTQSNQFSLSIVAKTVTVGTQGSTLTTGAAGTTTYRVTTTNIDNSQAGTILWYSNSGGTAAASAPTGVTTSVSTGNANRTLTVNTTSATPEGTYYFRVMIDGIQSGVGTLTINPAPIVKTVTVGTQISAISAGAAGTTTYSVTTVNIATSQTGTVQWYSNSGGTTAASAPTGVTTSVSTGNVTRTLTANITSATPAGTYYFRVTIDGVPSDVGTLTIDAQKTVSVGAQGTTLTSGTAGSTTYSVTTANITNSLAGTVQWYSNSGGTTSASAPTGVTPSVSTGNATRTLTMNTTSATPAGTYYFRVTIDGVQSSNVGRLTINAPVKSVVVGTQVGVVRENVTNSYATFTVTTANIANSQAGTVEWYSNSGGTISMGGTPLGIATSLTTGNAIRTLTVTNTGRLLEGTMYFRVTIDGVTSNVGTLIISPRQYVTIGSQVGAATAGTPRSVTYSVTTTNITNLQAPGTIVWYSDAFASVPASPPTGVTTSITTGSATRTLTVTTTSATPAGTYLFRITIDGVGSAAGTLTINAPVKSVSVGAPSRTMAAGVANYTVNYTVTTQNIANGYYTVSVANLPTGVSVYSYLYSISPIRFYDVNITNGSGTLTLRGNGSQTVRNVTNLTLTLDGATSNSFALNTVTKTVTVGTASAWPIQGSTTIATYTVTTSSTIATSQTATVQWYSDAAGTVTTTAPPNVTTTVTTGSTTRTLRVNTTSAPRGRYYFRVIIDGVPSNVGEYYVQYLA